MNKSLDKIVKPV